MICTNKYFYRFYSATVAMETGDGSVSWSEVYSDFFLAEDVLSACVPVWDQPTAMLLGVTCIDVNVTYFTSLTNGEQVKLILMYFYIVQTLGAIQVTKHSISGMSQC